MNYMGIDIAKKFHVVTILDENEVKVFKKAFRIENDIDGYFSFIKKLDSISLDKTNFLIGFEATVIYCENLLVFLKI